MKPHSKCSLAEIKAYNRAEEAKARILATARRVLRERNEMQNITDGEIQENQNAIADLTKEIALHQQQVKAFFEQGAAIEPPAPPLIAKLRANLDHINALTRNRQLAANIVAITTEAAQTFRRVQG